MILLYLFVWEKPLKCLLEIVYFADHSVMDGE